MIRRSIPPANIGADRWIGRYKPIAIGSTGSPRISITTATNAPQNTRPHGSVPPITPSTTSFINVACGAGSCTELPNPHAALSRYITPPIVSAATTAPISSPICCHIGVAPTIYPVLRSCEVSPAIAATIHITVPTQIADTMPA